MLKAMWRRGSNHRSFVAKADGRYIGIGACDRPSNTVSGFRELGFHGELAAAFDGYFCNNIRLRDGGRRYLSGLISIPGAFAFLAMREEYLIAGRDPVGQKPLYYGIDRAGMTLFASLRGALQDVRVEAPQPVPPGAMLEVSANGQVDVRLEHELKRPEETTISEDKAVETVETLFLEAVQKVVPCNSSIAFSGGLDSTLVAVAAKATEKNPELITVGVQGQPELEHAHRAATELGLPITILEVSPADVLESLSTVVPVVESTDPVIVGVSVPLYLACRKAREMGLDAIGAGQMSDELFGGYARFEEMALTGNYAQANSEIWKSVQAAPRNDFEPGDKIAVSLGLELRCPFAYLPLVEFGLQLPFSTKVNVSNKTATRKYVLRRVAEKWKLGPVVVDRPKMAVQYSSGVQKVLRKEAKRRSLSLGQFLARFC